MPLSFNLGIEPRNRLIVLSIDGKPPFLGEVNSAVRYWSTQVFTLHHRIGFSVERLPDFPIRPANSRATPLLQHGHFLLPIPFDIVFLIQVLLSSSLDPFPFLAAVGL